MLVVDVQPMYHQGCGPILQRLIDKLNRETPETVWYYVAEETGIGGDTEDDVREYLANHGLCDEAFDCITFIAKDYGFLRGWMDTGVDDETIVDTLKLMRQLGLNDSRDLESHEAIRSPDREHIMAVVIGDRGEAVFEPDFDVTPLLSRPRWEVAGGGMHECLKELELYAMSHGVEFNPKDLSLIYE